MHTVWSIEFVKFQRELKTPGSSPKRRRMSANPPYTHGVGHPLIQIIAPFLWIGEAHQQSFETRHVDVWTYIDSIDVLPKQSPFIQKNTLQDGSAFKKQGPTGPEKFKSHFEGSNLLLAMASNLIATASNKNGHFKDSGPNHSVKKHVSV